MTSGHLASGGAPSGDNLYPSTLELTFGDEELNLDVPAGVWNPTPHGRFLGHKLLELDFSGDHVLELGTGCGIHAILLARRGAAKLTLTEIAPEIIDNARHNLSKHDVGVPIETVVCDWIQVPGGPFDVLVTNPPFAKSGKKNRRYFIQTMIQEAHKLLVPGGRLVFVQSSMANIPKTIEELELNGMSVRIVGETSGPFRPYYYEDEQFMLDLTKNPSSYFLVDGKHHERLCVFEATLQG